MEEKLCVTTPSTAAKETALTRNHHNTDRASVEIRNCKNETLPLLYCSNNLAAKVGAELLFSQFCNLEGRVFSSLRFRKERLLLFIIFVVCGPPISNVSYAYFL